MEWDFKPKDVIKGKVDYSLEDFVRDFKEEIDFNFDDNDKKKRKFLFKRFYAVVYYKSIGMSDDEIMESLSMPKELFEMVVEMNGKNIEMLGAIIMAMILKNKRDLAFYYPTWLDLDLVNSQLRHFHKLHKL